MQLRTTLTIRNDRMLAARERLDLTQHGLAELARVSQQDVCKFEALQYATVYGDVRGKAERISGALDLTPEDVLPPGHEEVSVPTRFVRVDEVALDRMLAMRERFILPAPDEVVAEQDDLEVLEARVSAASGRLTDRERLVLKLRSEGFTLDEVAEQLTVTRERVRQVGFHAIRRLGKFIEEAARAEADRTPGLSDAAYSAKMQGAADMARRIEARFNGALEGYRRARIERWRIERKKKPDHQAGT